MHYTTSCNTQSSAPEDGRDQRPKHVDMIGIINKPLLLHLVGVYKVEFFVTTRYMLHNHVVFLENHASIEILWSGIFV